MDKLNKYSVYAPVLLRIGMSLVFLWFGTSQVMDVENWSGIVPAWAASIFGSADTIVILNGWFEIVFSVLLILGFQTRIVSLLLSLHLFGIASTFGLSPIGVRDNGLAIATLAIFLHGPDIACLDTKLKLRAQAGPSTL